MGNDIDIAKKIFLLLLMQRLLLFLISFYFTSRIQVSLPGNFAFLDYIKILHEAEGKPGLADVTKFKTLSTLHAFVETSTIPYACRLLGGNEVSQHLF